MKRYVYVMAIPIRIALDIALVLPLSILCLVSRLGRRKNDVGIGPEPIISHKYQKKALNQWGYSVRTFVNSVYFVTDEFDIRGDLLLGHFGAPFLPYLLFIWVIFNCRALYIYFRGGPLFRTRILWRVEPLFYKMAGVKVVVMPYGADVQELSRCKNLRYKAAVSKDYPAFRMERRQIERKIDLWTKHASHVISGCDWVEYMYHWDTLLLAHFTIDVDLWKPEEPSEGSRQVSAPLRILHAPNHRSIKGTKHFMDAVEKLKHDGFEIELVICEKVPNDTIREMMKGSDIIADQLVIGWYGMFAVEAMAMGKPVLCSIRSDFEDLFIDEGLLEPGELPIIRCTSRCLKSTLIHLIENRDELEVIGKKSREFILKHHSTESIGKVFDYVNRSIGIFPSGK